MGAPLLGNIVTDVFGWLSDRITDLTEWLDEIGYGKFTSRRQISLPKTQ